MVDYIKLRIETYFPKPVHRRMRFIGYSDYNGRIRDYYNLYSKKGDCYLTIHDCLDYFVLSGSMRKWILGKHSHEDLTPKQLVQAIEEIASTLGLKTNDIADARILTIEFGKTFTLHGTTCRNVIDKIYSYSTFYKPKTYKGESITFDGQDYHFQFYDKTKEITDKHPKLKKSLHSTNRLRIELRLKDRKGIDGKFRGFPTLAKLYLGYRMAVVTFLNEIKKVRFKSNDNTFDSVSFKNRSVKDLKQYLIYKGILNVGIGTTFSFINELNCSDGGKYKYQREFKKLMQDMERLDKYGRTEFIRQIKKELAQVISDPTLNEELL